MILLVTQYLEQIRHRVPGALRGPFHPVRITSSDLDSKLL